MTAFDNVFGFFFNSENLKSLDEADLWLRCKIFMEIFLMITHPMLRSMIFFRVKGVTSDFDRFFDVSA